MIAIINTGEVDELGRAHYRLQINHKLIAEFDHHRKDGLAVCLALASLAVDRAQEDYIDHILKRAEQGNPE